MGTNNAELYWMPSAKVVDDTNVQGRVKGRAAGGSWDHMVEAPSRPEFTKGGGV